MPNIEFENLLGKHISVAEKVISTDFENNLFSRSFYFISDELIKKDFYNIKYNCLSIQTNGKDIVESITVHFRRLIERPFYDAFVQDYGEPDSILVIEKRHVISEGTYGDRKFQANLRKSELELREGSFDEAPLYIIWQKDGYEIKAFLRQENMSQITFSTKKEC